MTEIPSPRFAAEGFGRIWFSYESEDDLALAHLDEPREAVTWELGRGWHLRLSEDGDEVVGLELHGLRRMFLNAPPYSGVFAPAIREMEQFTGRKLAGGFLARGTIRQLPRTARLLVFMIGQAIEKHEAMRRAGYARAAPALPGEA